MYKKLVFTLFLMAGNVSAHAACGPGQCPVPTPNPNYHHPHANPTTTLSIGFFEAASPNCDDQTREVVVAEAKLRADNDAKIFFKTYHENFEIVRTSDYRVHVSCKPSIYAGASSGNSWSAQVFANYIASILN